MKGSHFFFQINGQVLFKECKNRVESLKYFVVKKDRAKKAQIYIKAS
jgi:hypothetical protein